MMINKHDFTFAIPPEDVGMKTGEYFSDFRSSDGFSSRAHGLL
jgi:hypothetical protein